MADNKGLEATKILVDMKELADALNSVTDYTLCMQMATKYKPSSAPNLLNIQRMLNRIKKEYEI